ncbi:MAG: hypothetical protein ACI959_001161 [Limisphaerales bacterium]|jgi:hypothetical protein
MTRITLLVSALVLCFSINAQNNFLLDTYLEVGISECGTHITNSEPFGSNSNGFNGLGIVADPEQDGWDVGTLSNYCGDFVSPGSPVEGFAIEYDGTVKKNGGQCNSFLGDDFIGGNTLHSSTAIFSSNLWEGGTNDGIEVRQLSVVANGSRSIIHRIEICNQTGADISNMYYMRNADPDNSQPWTGSFATKNFTKGFSFGTGASAVARSIDIGCEFLLLSADENATASYGNFNIGTPSDAISGLAGYNLTGSATADQAIQLTFDIGAVNDGDCACVAFAYVTDREEGIAAWKATKVACNTSLDGILGISEEGKLAEALFGSSNADLRAKISVYPNPANRTFIVDISGLNPELSVINLYNSIGALVLTRQASSSTEPIQHNLPAGMYVINVESEGKQHSTRIAIK